MREQLARHVMIIGVGGIGAAIGCRLASHYSQVTAVDAWRDHVRAIRQGGLTVAYQDETVTSHPAALEIEEIATGDIEEPSLVLLAVKSYDTTPVLERVAPYLGTAPIVSLQNCMNEEAIAAQVGTDRTIGAVVLFGAALTGPASAQSLYPAPLVIGELSGELTARVRAIESVLQPVNEIEVVNDIWTHLWGKLASNATINAISAVLDRTVGEIVADRRSAEVAVELGAESVRVAAARGYSLHEIEVQGARGGWMMAPRGSPDWYRAVEAVTVFFGRAPDAVVSMLQDVRKQRRTEVRELNGYVADVGRAIGVPTPLNARITEFVIQMERTQTWPEPTAALDELHDLLKAGA